MIPHIAFRGEGSSQLLLLFHSNYVISTLLQSTTQCSIVEGGRAADAAAYRELGRKGRKSGGDEDKKVHPTEFDKKGKREETRFRFHFRLTYNKTKTHRRGQSLPIKKRYFLNSPFFFQMLQCHSLSLQQCTDRGYRQTYRASWTGALPVLHIARIHILISRS